MLRFLSQTNNVIRAIRLDLQRREFSDILTKNFFTLYIVAIYKLKYIMKRLFDEGTLVDSRDYYD